MARIMTGVGTRTEITKMAPVVKAFERLEGRETLAIGAITLAGTDFSGVGARARTRKDFPREWPNPDGDDTTSCQVVGIGYRVLR